MPNLDEGVAYHEAGHAIVGHVLGFGVESVTIIENEGVAGEVTFAGEPPDLDADERRFLDYRWRELTCTLGGSLAEGRYCGEDVEFTPTYFYGDDWQDLNEFVHELAGEDSDKQDRVMDEAATHALQILVQNWSNVQAIALALMDHGQLSRAQLVSFLPPV